MEGIDEAVGRAVPACGDAGDGAAGFLVVGGEALEERDDDVHVGGGVHQVRVEGGGLVLIADEEGLGADSLLDGRLAFSAARETAHGEQESEDGKRGTHLRRKCGGRDDAKPFSASARGVFRCVDRDGAISPVRVF